MGKAGKDLNANTTCYVQVLGVGHDAASCQPSALLFFDRARYLFGVGEGYQRYAVQNRIKLSKTSGIFLTRLTPDGCGGIPGMLLTMADTPAAGHGGVLKSLHGLAEGSAASGAAGGAGAGAGASAGLSLHGPRGTSRFVEAVRTYVNASALGLTVSESAGEAAALPSSAPEAAAVTVEAEGGSGIVDPDTLFGEPVLQNDLVSIHAVVLETESGSAAEGPEAGAAEVVGEEPAPKRARGEGGADGAAASAALPLSPPPPSRPPLSLPTAWAPTAACSYIARLPDVPGKFLPQKAASLGVPRGPAYAQLVRGESIKAANGRTVTPADVMEAPTKGPVVVVLDCPTLAHLPALTASRALEGVRAAGPYGARVAAVVHLSPASVVEHPRYREFARDFSPSATHLVAAAGRRAGRPVMRASASLQIKLNALDPTFFPLPWAVRAQIPAEAAARGSPPAGAVDLDAAELLGVAGAVAGDDGLKFTVRPLAKLGVDAAEVPGPISVDETVREAREASPEAFALAEAAAAATPAPSPSGGGEPRGRASFTLLGTGAAIPSKYRNVTGSLWDFGPGQGTLLADCGEGSLGQLERLLGPEGAADAIRRLAVVWISHVHADHHAGLPGVLAAARCLGAPPPLVIGPRSLLKTLRALAKASPTAVRWLDASHVTARPEFVATLQGDSGVCDGAVADAPARPAGDAPDADAPAPGDARGAPRLPAGALEALAELRERLNLSLLATIPVEHCAHATGLAMRSRDGWRVVLSGDTRPCEAVATAARGADLLVHEATFEAGMEADAAAKSHSTLQGALSVAAKARPGTVLLTHFSQRYPKVPDFDGAWPAGEEALEDRVAVAFDNLRVNLADLPLLPRTLKPARALLRDELTAKAAGEDDV